MVNGEVCSFTVLIAIMLISLVARAKLEPKDSVFEFVFQSVIKYESLIVFPIASLVISLANHLVQVLYGESYPLTPLFLRILMINFFSVGVGGLGVIGNLINSQKDTKIQFQRTLLFILSSIPMGYYLIPRFGVVGLEVTLILAPKIGVIYALWWIKQRYNLSVDYGTLGRILLSTILGYILCEVTIKIIDLNPWIEIFAGGGVFLFTYLFAILYSGAITRRNIEDIYNIVSRFKHFKPQINLFFRILNKIARY